MAKTAKTKTPLLERLSVQGRILLTSIITSLIISMINIYLFVNINAVIGRINRIYMSNVVINDIFSSLGDVQDSLTAYLNTRSSDAMEEYFRTEQDYHNKLMELEPLSDSEATMLQRNIVNLSETYIEYADAAVQARRGHIIERYKLLYSEASETYDYINAYIYRLNVGQFALNTENYNALVGTFRVLEMVSLIVIIMMSVINVVLIYMFTRNIMDPVRERELRMEAHIKDAELKYLEAQINPHFLFNTLNAGAQLAMMEGADRTNEYIQKMAEFYRYKIHGGSQETTLEKEITLVDNYIYILNVRFSGDIHYEKDVESLPDVRMPDMILQPIVENAVNHGIRNIDREGRIKLSVFADGEGRTVIRISDNGVGMSPERIEEVLKYEIKSDESKGSNGVGLKNVISRLELYYGSRDIMKIESEGQDKGTCISIYLPEEP